MRHLFSLALVGFLLVLTSCEFSESMVLNADGSGEIKIQMDASDLVAMMLSMGGEEELQGMEERMDTTFFFADFLRESKDSIALLPLSEQEKLKMLEPYGVRIMMDAKEGKMFSDIFLNFKDISEANDMFRVFNDISATGPNTVSASENTPAPESIQVRYSFANKVFKRTAVITDQVLHQQELDSLQSMEMMMGSTVYKLNYTFPSKIKSASNSSAKFSSDKKTLFLEANYFDYFRNPELLSVEVILD